MSSFGYLLSLLKTKKLIYMPQLDKLTFFSQFFWLSFFFLGFYIILVKYYLPKMSRILKIRNIKVSESSGSLSYIKKENENVRDGLDQLALNGLKYSKQSVNTNFDNTFQWANSVIESTNKGQFQNINKLYLTTVGNFSMSQAIMLNHLKTVIAPSATQDISSEKEGNSYNLVKEKLEILYSFNLIEILSK